MIDRDAQYKPLLTELTNQMILRKASDAAVGAQKAQQAVVDDLAVKLNLVHRKTQDRGGATSADWRRLADLTDQMEVEYAKLGEMKAKTTTAWPAFTDSWQKSKKLHDDLLQDPGAVENTSGTPLL